MDLFPQTVEELGETDASHQIAAVKPAVQTAQSENQPLRRSAEIPFLRLEFPLVQHGFQFFGMITVVTDVVRENNQTYRLGWTEQCKDGTKMGVGCPEYVLLFRKLPTDTSTAYADVPVVEALNAAAQSEQVIG